MRRSTQVGTLLFAACLTVATCEFVKTDPRSVSPRTAQGIRGSIPTCWELNGNAIKCTTSPNCTKDTPNAVANVQLTFLQCYKLNPNSQVCVDEPACVYLVLDSTKNCQGGS
jgi:hypothetical protein